MKKLVETMKDLDEVIENVKTNHKLLKSYINSRIDAGQNVMLFHITGENVFKAPVWFAENTQTYDATKLKDKILTEFEAKPGYYGYGFLLGKQPAGNYLLCIDIDVDNACKEIIRDKIEKGAKKYGIQYHTERTKSDRYHIYFAVNKINENIKKITKLKFNCNCKKYKDGKEVQGEVELLGANSPHTITAYDSILNTLKPVFIEPSLDITPEILEKFLLEIQDAPVDDEIINKLIDLYSLIRKHNYINGWEIDKVVSAFCLKNELTDQTIVEIFKAIYKDEYDEKATEYIIKHTKEKQLDLLPGIKRIIEHAKGFYNSGKLTDDEKATIRNILETITRNKNDEDLELPDYLVGVENVYLKSSYKKHGAKKGTYYKEKYFIEREKNGVKQVLYIELESKEPNAIFKQHELLNEPKVVCVKVEILRILKEKKKVPELLINDEFTFIPSFSFNRLEDIAIEISTECFDYLPRFDIPLFQDYLAIKVDEYRAKNDGKSIPCVISKSTGWNDDYTMFYHYDLNDDKHELGKDHPLYKYRKAKSFNQKEQHELVYKLLQEGKLLSVLLTISASSILLKPLNLQPLTCILAGGSGSGKTTSSLIATSLFYKSDEILINANNTKVGIELTLASMNSMPLTIDEGALINSDIDLKHLIFSVASKKGKARGRKDLSVDIKDLISNVIYTTETADTDDIKRAGTFRRMIYLLAEYWNDFTNLIDLSTVEQTPNEQFAGCGVDYIKFVLENMEKIKKRFDKETRTFYSKYRELVGIAKNLFGGIILLEEFYCQYYKAEQPIVFAELRKRINDILETAKRTFIASKDNIVEAVQHYLYSNNNRLDVVEQVRDNEGAYKYMLTQRATGIKEKLGEYDKTTETYYITVEGFKTIAKAIEKERTLLENALIKAGVIKLTEKGEKNFTYHSKATKEKIRVYKIKFGDIPSNPEQPAPSTPQPEPPPEPIEPEQPPEPIEPKIDEPDDSLVDAFSRTTYEKPKEKEKAQEPKEKKKSQQKHNAKKKEEEKAQAQIQAQAEEDNKIIINEDELNIYDVKPRSEIPKFEIKQKDLVKFNELAVGSIDIETTGLNETDQILAIAFNVYKGDKIEAQHRFYLDEYNDETKMVDAFLDTLSKSDIDVLTGYNIYGFDLPMIKAKDQNNRLRFTDQVNVSNVFIKGEIQQGYKIIIDNKEIDVIDAYYLVLKYDSVARTIPAQDYKLKSVAKYFNISKSDRVILGADEIREAYKTNRKLFDAYFDEDVREAYEIFKKLAPAYYYIRSIVPFNISFFDAFRLSTAAVWERILERYYDKEYTSMLVADEKADYEGGLVIVNRGIYKNVYKIDVASLYPNIMLNYHVCSLKDVDKIALAILNEYTNLRLELKKKAKEGDKEADLVQNSLKILINSLYGFYGTAGYLFNDMNASALITAYGRRILKEMIFYVEKNNGIIIECDTDGIYYSAPNGEEIYQGLRKVLNKINFDIELEYRDCIMFASDKKNYILIEPNGKIVKKGSKYAGRDKNKLQTEFVVEYIKRYIEDPAKAESYKEQIRNLIASGKAYDLLKVTKKVGKNEKNIIIDGALRGLKLEQGSIVTYAYKNYRKRHYTFDIDEVKTYDEDYYLNEFDKLVKEIDEVIKC